MDCIHCGNQLTGRQRKYCSTKCCYDWENARKAKAKADSLGLPVGHKPCSLCGTVFKYKHNGNLFCSVKCKLTRKKKDKQFKASAPYVASQRAKRYGLTVEELEALEEAASHQCQICGIHEKDAPKKRLHVDHDHEAGNVRGLLCMHCNQGLGKFGDDVSRLSKAIEYLSKGSP